MLQEVHLQVVLGGAKQQGGAPTASGGEPEGWRDRAAGLPLALLRSTPLRRFSDISMCVYMVHCEVFRYLVYYKLQFPQPDAATATGVVFAWLLAVALVVGLAWAINRYVEAPAARAFEWLLLPRRG